MSIRHEKLRNRVNLYRMKEQREISPSTFAHLVSSTLYERRCVIDFMSEEREAC
jgi:20S proteasome alpha/beta subunit